jgi:murein DD-endopeptidase MepM/ murein hydrolase activator NlpD
MKSIPFLALIILLASCGVQHRFTSKEAAAADTSYIYTLPYPKGVSHLLIQGYNSKLSHRGRIMLDFKMDKGSSITAARAGVVIRAIDSFSKGGFNKKYLGKANQITIKHDDGSQAMYAHLQKDGALVKVGDTVRVGQLIAKSGSVGYSAFPHLHFVVWGPTPRGRAQLPTRFYTKKGIQYLRPGCWHRQTRQF